MALTRSKRGWAGALAVLATMLLNPLARGAASTPSQELSAIAEEAYIFGYPLVVTDMTRRQLTAVPAPKGNQAPMNQFAVLDKLPDPNFKAVVRPNVDTLYASAFLDLSREPIVLSVPDMEGRYYLMPMLDAYTNVFASPGARTTGTDAQSFAIVGPGWRGELPKGVTEIRAPTNLVWILGRTEILGPSDLPHAVALSKQFKLTPLSAWGRPYEPPPVENVAPGLPMSVKPPDAVAKMSVQEFFSKLAALMEQNPPSAADQAAMKRFARIGLQPGRFAPSSEATRAIEGVPQRALAKIAAHRPSLGTVVNGWLMPMKLGGYGTRYLDRATVALVGLGANLPEDAIYPQLFVDSKGEKLDGANAYVLRFPKGETPPVRGFWSLTMYDPQGYLVANPIQRYAIGDRDALRRNPDGSLDIYVQHRPPAPELRSNWLPAPAGPFNLTLRMYWPEERVLSLEWKPPPMVKRPPPSVGRRPPPRR